MTSCGTPGAFITQPREGQVSFLAIAQDTPLNPIENYGE